MQSASRLFSGPTVSGCAASVADVLDGVRRMVTAARFRHTIGVMETAVRLARLYGADPDKAALASAVHDCARDLEPVALLKMVDDFGIVVDKVQRAEPKLLHGPVGAELARREFGVSDEAVLRSVAIHTTGSTAMTRLDKIVYVADYAEPGRRFKGVDVLRQASRENLDLAVALAFDQTLVYLISRKAVIHPSTIAARNELILTGGLTGGLSGAATT